MTVIDVRTQAELDAAIAAGNIPNLIGDETATFDVSAAGVVHCSGSSSPCVEAYGPSSPRVEAYGHSSPRVEAYGPSSPRVEAYDSSSPRVEAYGDSNVTTQGNVSVAGGKGKRAPVVVPAKPRWSTPAEWCEYHGVKVVRGVAVLYKAVCDDWRGSHKTSVTYEPGSQPEAPDWNGGKAECGKGLHFSPRPAMALRFCPDAAHFLACKVRLADMAVHPAGDYPAKCKAAKVCAPCVEVNIDGDEIGAAK